MQKLESMIHLRYTHTHTRTHTYIFSLFWCYLQVLCAHGFFFLPNTKCLDFLFVSYDFHLDEKHRLVAVFYLHRSYRYTACISVIVDLLVNQETMNAMVSTNIPKLFPQALFPWVFSRLFYQQSILLFVLVLLQPCFPHQVHPVQVGVI